MLVARCSLLAASLLVAVVLLPLARRSEEVGGLILILLWILILIWLARRSLVCLLPLARRSKRSADFALQFVSPFPGLLPRMILSLRGMLLHVPYDRKGITLYVTSISGNKRKLLKQSMKLKEA